ncbi:MAG TPA: alpha/beta hydrolase [Chloroflexia bacterium]|jgi:pimeloyl-ACP methyl ester carboxylesterase
MLTKRVHIYLSIALVTALMITTIAVTLAQTSLPGTGSRTFSETGKTVTGIFLDYWDKNGGLPQQGFPISGVMSELSDLDSKTYTVQYFERAVFEHHPENQPPHNVLLSQLGTFQYRAKYPNAAPDQKPNTNAGSTLFQETGKRVGGKFLDYWKAHGGLAQQGFPISEEFSEKSDLDGQTYTVQYFERAVFEMHPENAPPFDVLLSQLGTFQYRAKYAAGNIPTTPPPAPAPASDGLVDVGGHKLYYSCRGTGSPTIIMEAGLATTSRTWSPLLPDLEKTTRVCVYDRANLGLSERGPNPRTSAQVVKELHALLTNAKIPAPYVLVGHSQGGLHVQLYARTYQSEIAGIVLVDGVPPDIDERYEAVLAPAQAQQRRDIISQNPEGATYEDTHLSALQVRAAASLPNVPMLVLTHGKTLQHPAGWPVEAVEKAWREGQETLAKSTTQGRLIVADQSGHFIHTDQPDLVISSIREAVEKAR